MVLSSTHKKYCKKIYSLVAISLLPSVFFFSKSNVFEKNLLNNTMVFVWGSCRAIYCCCIRLLINDFFFLGNMFYLVGILHITTLIRITEKKICSDAQLNCSKLRNISVMKICFNWHFIIIASKRDFAIYACIYSKLYLLISKLFLIQVYNSNYVRLSHFLSFGIYWDPFSASFEIFSVR